MKKKKRNRSKFNTLAPPREGLIPGTWKMMDPSRIGGIVDQPRRPLRWNPRHVGMRLIEAHRTLKYLPMNLRPAAVKTAWPMHDQEPVEGAVEEGNVKVDPSAEQIALMEQAICWPMRFLGESMLSAGDVNRWAGQLTVEEFEKIEDGHHSVPWHELRAIAGALNAAREIVR